MIFSRTGGASITHDKHESSWHSAETAGRRKGRRQRCVAQRNKIILFPKQCLHWRCSGGVAKEGAMDPSVTRSRTRPLNFCCYLPYFVHVTFATLQRNGRFFQICCKLQYKINVVSRPDSLRKSSKGRLRAIWGLMNHTYRLVLWSWASVGFCSRN